MAKLAVDVDQKTVIHFQFKSPSITAQNNPAQTNSFPLGDFLTALLGTRNDALAMNIRNTLAGNSDWHSLRVIAWNHHRLQIWIDEINAANISDTSIHYTISTILNFINTASSEGVLRNFSLENQVYDLQYRKKINAIIDMLASLFFTVTLMSFFYLARSSLEKEDKIQVLSFGVLLGFVVAVFFHYIQSFYYGAIYPSNTFIFYGAHEQFKDFYDTMKQAGVLNPYYTLPNRGEYFPLTYILLFPLSILKLNLALSVYYGFCLGFYFVFLKKYLGPPGNSICKKYQNAANILTLGFLSYPFLFIFERGNIEFILFLSLATFLFFYSRKKIWYSLPFLIIAICLKAYPIVFLVLLWSDKHYCKALFVFGFSILLSLLSLAMMKHGFNINLNGFKSALSSLTTNCTIVPDRCVNFSSGLWGAIKTFYLLFAHSALNYKKMQIYTASSVLVFFVISLYIYFVEKVAWKKTALLTFPMILFPFVSYDYRLMLVLLPLFSFLENESSRYDLFYAVVFILLLIPKNYYILPNSTSISCLLNPLLLVLMSTFIIWQGISNKLNFFTRL